MEALDGNSIAGPLFELFAREMTTVSGACVHCGSTSQIAELEVYRNAPGTVVRCPSCCQVVIVLTEVRGVVRINHDDFDLR